MLATLLLAAAPSLGCAGKATHISTTATLGRVVVYRSGVAFYERKAHLEDGTLSVRVPRDRVDDFLKSMTIVDSGTGEHLPVTIPRQQAQDGDFLVMDLTTPGHRVADVVLTYVTEAPAWKPSYRITAGDDDKVRLEAWAVVDNTSGEDWNDVLVGVGSSSALSFRYDLWSVRTIDREQVAERTQRSIAPPTSVSPFAAGTGDASTSGAAVVAVFDELGRGYDTNIPVAGRTFEAALGNAAGSQGDGLGIGFSGSSSLENQYYIDGIDTTGLQYGSVGEVITVEGRAPMIDTRSTSGITIDSDYTRSVEFGERRALEPAAPARPAAMVPRDYTQFAAMVRRMRETRGQLVIQHSVPPGGADAAGHERAETIRDQLIDAGLAAAKVRIESASAPAGATAGLRVVLLPDTLAADGGAGGGAAPIDDEPVGESHFLATVPLDVPAATSAMVALLSTETAGKVAYFYDPVSERGDQRYAFRALRVENPTGETLEAGPLTVYGDARFIGEGLLEAIPPHATTVVPFAQDRQVVIDRAQTFDDRMVGLTGIDRDSFTASIERSRTTNLTIHNRLTTATTVYVRQPIDGTWQLKDAPDKRLRLPTSYLIPVEVPASGSAKLVLTETMPTTRDVAIASRAATRLLRAYLADGTIATGLREPIRALLATGTEIDGAGDEIETLRSQQLTYDERARELHAQLLTLKAVKTAGPLMTELSAKLRELTDLSQRATLMIVAAQDRLAIARAQQVAQLMTLGAGVEAAASAPAVAVATTP